MKPEIFGVKAPKKQCTDKKCPFHGELNIKRELFRGVLIKKDSHHSATIEWNRPFYIPKYERFETRRSRLRVHNPPCLEAQVGQEVLAAKTRPLSKSKNHVIIQITKKKLKETKTKQEEASTPKKVTKENIKDKNESS